MKKPAALVRLRAGSRFSYEDVHGLRFVDTKGDFLAKDSATVGVTHHDPNILPMDGGSVAYPRRSARLAATHDPRGSRRVVRECAQSRINPRVETMSFAVSAASGAAVAIGKSARPGESGFSRRGSRGGVAKTRATGRALGASRAARGVRRGLVVANDAGQDAYNKAMQEYSKTPFEYRHELGLCACPRRVRLRPRTPVSARVRLPVPRARSTPRASPTSAPKPCGVRSRPRATPRSIPGDASPFDLTSPDTAGARMRREGYIRRRRR